MYLLTFLICPTTEHYNINPHTHNDIAAAIQVQPRLLQFLLFTLISLLMAPLSRLLSLAALTASCTNAIDVRMGVSLIDHIENQVSFTRPDRPDSELTTFLPTS